MFSVVIPLHNKGKYIERAIRSVFAQSCPDWRLLVIDDASTDQGPSVAEGLFAGDPRCLMVPRDSPGPGGYAARNLGASLAESEWLAFLDADDEWKPGHLDGLRELIGLFPGAGFLCTARWDMHPSGALELDRFSRGEPTQAPRLLDLLAYCEEGRKDRNPIQTSAVGMAREVFSRIGGFPAGRCDRGGDRDTWLRAVDECGLAWNPEPSVIYHRDAENMVTKNTAIRVGQCCDDTICAFLAGRHGRHGHERRIRRGLKRLGNFEKKNAIRIRLKTGGLSVKEFRSLYLGVEPIYCLSVLALSIIPVRVRGAVHKAARFLKASMGR